ncbi:hypothetical protein POM88_053397 [Heracleum sosnowskyi]|uniref:RNase H type-1 domain-containing protein n=1 Tax=Heracleum sosnowskyi TaxID=360622 RepID=A0AAD8LXW5_9APIA|nr:hypothetical protein POM88_053397 [Heracleum sosnowskyi]
MVSTPSWCDKIECGCVSNGERIWIGMGVVARDHEGNVVAAAVRRLRAWWPPQIAEGRAILLAVKLARRLRHENIIIESDCESLIQRLSKASTYLSDFDNVLEDILASCSVFDSIQWIHVKRDDNLVAHHLAKLVPFGTEQVWVNHYPYEISPYVISIRQFVLLLVHQFLTFKKKEANKNNWILQLQSSLFT